MKQPEHQDCWRGSHLDWQYKIILHSKGQHHAAGGQGTWCYYIYIAEHRIGTPAFEKLWLDPEVSSKWKFVTYNYFNTPVSNLDWHGGVTFYAKHGEVVGHRCVEFGYDYNHLYDGETKWTLELVLANLERTIEQLEQLYPASELRSH